MYYGFNGEPITREEWCHLFDDIIQRTLGLDSTDPRNSVSTVWLGLEHGYNNGKPLIFESLVNYIDEDGNEQEEMHRYTSYVDAKNGHAALVKKYLVKDKLDNQKQKTKSRFSDL